MRHPVQSCLQHHGHAGTIPTADELGELKLPADVTAAIRSAASEAREHRVDGWNQRADAHALESARTIIADLPESQRDPGYLKPDPNTGLENLSPAELAARVPRD